MTHTDVPDATIEKPTAVATIPVPEMRRAALVEFLDSYRTHRDVRLADMAEQLVAYLQRA
jgi:hypothetical protein